MALVAPSIISYRPYITGWDDLYFFHRALSLNHAVWHLDAKGWAETFSILSKSPIMALIAAPWGGPDRNPEALLGLLRVTLAVTTWCIVLACAHLLLRMAVDPWLSLVAAMVLVLNPVLLHWAGFYMADALVSWTTLLLLLLIPYESITEDFSRRQSVYRGLLWAFVFSIGVLSKVTFWALLAGAAPAILFLRFRRGGWRAVSASLSTCLLASLPALVIVIHYGDRFLNFAEATSVGAIAHYFASPHQSYGTTLLFYWRSLGPTAPIVLIPALCAIFQVFRRRWNFGIWYGILLLTAYGVEVTTSLVRDPRYFLPVAIALPFLIAAAGSRLHLVKFSWGPPAFALALLVSTLASWPMKTTIELSAVRTARSLLLACRSQGAKTALLASDSQAWNIETFLLARELLGGSASNLAVETVVYSVVQGTALDADRRRIAAADIVIVETPTPANEATVNQRTDEYRKSAIAHGELLPATAGPLQLFRIRH
jgi:hypothetical protein